MANRLGGLQTLLVARLLIDGASLREAAIGAGVHRKAAKRIKTHLDTFDPEIVRGLPRTPRLWVVSAEAVAVNGARRITHTELLIGLIKCTAVQRVQNTQAREETETT